MQTFITDFSFFETARTLDNKRLGKQRVEAMQILRILLGEAKRNRYGNVAWANHPAVKMWRGNECDLALYGCAMCRIWSERGFTDNLYSYFHAHWVQLGERSNRPEWLDEKFINAHRAALLVKDPKWYAQFNWNIEPKIDYIWPV